MKRGLLTHTAHALALLAVQQLMPSAVPTAHAADGNAATPATAADADADEGKLARGKYLVTVAGCNDCHTPWKPGLNGPEPDMSRMLSGHPADMSLPPPPKPDGPWIVSAAVTNTAWSGPGA